MTTIVYHHESRQIAVDSRGTNGGVIYNDKCVKAYKRDDRTYYLAGTVCDFEKFIHEHITGTPSDEKLDVYAFMVKDGVAYDVNKQKGVFKREVIEYNDALGSGWQWALAAMDHGKTAAQAVKYAATRDVHTGGKIHVFKV